MTFRARLGTLIDRPLTQNFIIAVIVVNAITLGMETSTSLMQSIGWLILAIDRACLAIFTIEIAAKLVARGPAFFRNGWSLFDFTVLAPSRFCGRSESCGCCAWFQPCRACAA